MTTNITENLTVTYRSEEAARAAGKEWVATTEGQRFIAHSSEPGAVLFTYPTNYGWDWAVRCGDYTLSSRHLTDNYTLDVFTDADSLSGWLGINRITGDTSDLIRRAVLGTLPLVSEGAAEQGLLFRLLLCLAPATPDWVLSDLLDDPSDVVAYHAMNRVLKAGADERTVQKAQALNEELEEQLLDMFDID